MYEEDTTGYSKPVFYNPGEYIPLKDGEQVDISPDPYNYENAEDNMSISQPVFENSKSDIDVANEIIREEFRMHGPIKVQEIKNSGITGNPVPINYSIAMALSGKVVQEENELSNLEVSKEQEVLPAGKMRVGDLIIDVPVEAVNLNDNKGGIQEMPATYSIS